MITLPKFIEWCKKINYENHVPSDLEIRTYMAKNSLKFPHFDTCMHEGVSGSGTFISRVNKPMLLMLPKNQAFVLGLLHMQFEHISIKAGQRVILPHAFYWFEPDQNTTAKIKMIAALEL